MDTTMKKKNILRKLMTVITMFSLSFAIVYALKSGSIPIRSADVYSNTLYNTLKGEEITVNAINNEDSIDNYFTDVINDEIPQVNDATAAEEPEAAAVSYDMVESDTFYSEAAYDQIKVFDHTLQTVSVMPLDEYVACVVTAEMPGDSPPEALKAQAVAVRTLAVKYIGEAKKSEHMGADICTDPGHCQGFITKMDFTDKYGSKGAEVFTKVENAVNATKGLILLYDNQPIVAVFHASSGNSTASSKEVWGGSLDYLISVDTAEITDDTLREQVINEVTFTREEFISRLSDAGIAEVSEYKESPFHTWICAKELSESGRVASIEIAGRKLSGKEIRSILGLKSSDFEIGFEENKITFITKGYGHGVGMSQLGAVAMANKGESFYSILAKYYPGTIIGII